MKKNLHLFLRVIVFCLLVCVVLSFVSIPFVDGVDARAYTWAQSLREERPGALDVVFIGSSNTYAFFNPLLAWQYYGIPIHTYAVSSQKPEAFKYMITEARKTQPDALYVISLGNSNLRLELESVHYLTDLMPFSKNKLELLQAYSKYNEFSAFERAELLVPFIRFHSRWESLTSYNFAKPPVFAKGMNVYNSYLNISTDISESARVITTRCEINEAQMEVLTDLMDYLRDNEIRAVFLAPPQMGVVDWRLEQVNTELDILAENGFPVIYRWDYLDDVGYDFTRDYYNVNHTNIHGAAKYTEYFTRYLMEHYDLRDKRGDPAYADFDEALADYREAIAPYTLDFELEVSARDIQLAAPEQLELTQTDEAAVFSWNECPEADGYLVYRQFVESEGTRSPWERIADIKAPTLSFEDTGAEAGSSCCYTVVPYRMDGDSVQYGSWVHSGIGFEGMEND